MSEAKFFKPEVPEIPEAERTPLVQALLAIVGQQQEHLQRQAIRIEQLEDELRRLKGGSKRPQLKPSQLEGRGKKERPKSTGQEDQDKKRRGKPARRKTEDLTIHETKHLEVESVPAGATFKGYRRFVVQDLKLETHNTCYWLAQWKTPSGEYLSAELPPGLAGGHYGPTLASYVLYQYHHNHVTQPLLLEQLRDWGVEISAGQLNHLLLEDQEAFHQEKADLKAAGLQVSAYVQTDDTGARHQGRNGYCTYLGNEHFAWFESTESKSRINFLECLQPQRRYVLNASVLAYLADRGLAQDHLQVLGAFGDRVFSCERDWQVFLAARGVLGQRAVALASEGALLGGLLAQGISQELGIVSDGARQFQILVHGLCWVHAERAFAQLMPLNETERRAIEWVRDQIWWLYHELKAYQLEPNAAHRAHIEAAFEALCATETVCATLNQALSRFYEDKPDLLRVLERPELPVHNNLSESDLREYVKKRKISGTTRSDEGRRCRDTFASLKKTCRKQGLSFWQYLKDRLSRTGLIPPLADLIRQAANA